MTIGPSLRGPSRWRRAAGGCDDLTSREGARVTVIAEFGIFLGGIGVFFIGCALFWWVSEWKKRV